MNFGLGATIMGSVDGGWPPVDSPQVFVCGPTGFVEAVADLLVRGGHGTGAIKTERFGPSGGKP